MFGVISRPSRSGARKPSRLGEKDLPKACQVWGKNFGCEGLLGLPPGQAWETCKLLGLKGSASSSGLAGLPEIAFWFALF